MTNTRTPPERGVEEVTLPVRQRYLKEMWRGGGCGNRDEALRQKRAQKAPNRRNGKRRKKRRKSARRTRKGAE